MYSLNFRVFKENSVDIFNNICSQAIVYVKIKLSVIKVLTRNIMQYIIHELRFNLLLIVWDRRSLENSKPEANFVDDLKSRLDKASEPIYFISDLRNGRVINVRILQRLGALTRHDNWAGSTAFSSDPISNTFVGVFAKFAHKEEREIWDTPEEAIVYLESLKEGVTQDIDWDAFIL